MDGNPEDLPSHTFPQSPDAAQLPLQHYHSSHHQGKKLRAHAWSVLDHKGLGWWKWETLVVPHSDIFRGHSLV